MACLCALAAVWPEPLDGSAALANQLHRGRESFEQGARSTDFGLSVSAGFPATQGCREC